MEDLSLHVMDIVENSLRAGAKNVSINLVEDINNDKLTIEIEDDGTGMDGTLLKNAANPFFTTKNGKRFGLGLSLLEQASTQAGGNMTIKNRVDKGIQIVATFDITNIDIKPVGDMEKTMRVLEATHPDVKFSFKHLIKNRDLT